MPEVRRRRSSPTVRSPAERSRTAQQRLINHSAPRWDGGPCRPPPIPAPLPQKQPLPCTGFKGFCACACVCFSISPPLSLLFFVCVCKKEVFFFFSLPREMFGTRAWIMRKVSAGEMERQTDGAKENQANQP